MALSHPLRHPLLGPPVRTAVRRAAEAHRGTPWTCTGFTDLGDLAAHPCGIFRGHPFPVFAKLSTHSDAAAQFTAELAGLRLLRDLSGAQVPVPVADRPIAVPPGTHLLLFEALPERPPGARTPEDWRSIGRALATLHAVSGPAFGLETNGYFGPLPQDNTPVHPSSWTTFYAERRLLPHLRLAADSGYLPATLADRVTQLIGRLPALAGPEPRPALLHGDAQQHNFVSTPAVPCWWTPHPTSATRNSISRCSATSTRCPGTSSTATPSSGRSTTAFRNAASCGGCSPIWPCCRRRAARHSGGSS